MAQAFETFYAKTMKWNKIRKTKSKKPLEEFYEQPPEGDFWLERALTNEQMMRKFSMEQLEEMLLKMYLSRYWTTYGVDYCNQSHRGESEPGHTKEVENELIEYGKRVFSDSTEKILKPMATSRKLFGYMRPKRMYMGLTEYQDTYSQLGYNILRIDDDKIKAKKMQQLIK